MKRLFFFALAAAAVFAATPFAAGGGAQSSKEAALSDPFIPLADGFLVAGQISPEDVAQAAAEGVTLIINNRPDGEAPGQPKSADIAKAAEAAGLRYVEIFVDRSGITAAHLDAFDAARAEQTGKTLAFCRTGTRSTTLRSYAAARTGEPVDQIIAEAAAAGYDLRAHEPALRALAAVGDAGEE
ncbi:MAG: TIGR01244 family sulfur transferase [Parvularculaceae bacterium]